MRTSNITKLRICGCGLQELRSCGLAVADFKNYEVADLRLRIQESRNIVADLRLRTKLLNVQLRTCGCGLRKLKFGCGFADCGLEKKLAVPSTAHCIIHRQALMVKTMPDELSHILDKLIKTLNFIKAKALNSRLFAELCKESDSVFENFLLHTRVRWLSKGKC